MTEEDFFNAYYFYNEEVIDIGRYVHVGYLDFPGEIMPIVHAVAEKRIDKSLPQGEKELRIDINDDERTLERTLAIIEENFMNPQTVVHNPEFSLDYRFLEHQQVIDFLNNCRENGYISSIKIVGDNYTSWWRFLFNKRIICTNLIIVLFVGLIAGILAVKSSRKIDTINNSI